MAISRGKTKATTNTIAMVTEAHRQSMPITMRIPSKTSDATASCIANGNLFIQFDPRPIGAYRELLVRTLLELTYSMLARPSTPAVAIKRRRAERHSETHLTRSCSASDSAD